MASCSLTRRAPLRRPLQLGLWALLIAGAACDGGCRGCLGEAPIAELEESVGEVAQAEAKQPESWQEAPTGTEFQVGDGVRTGESAGAVLALARGGGLRLGERTTIRFLRGAQQGDDSRFRVETGEAEIEGGATGFVFETSIGLARIEGGGRLRLVTAADSLRFEVMLGVAEIEREGQEALKLAAGEEIVLDIGGVVIEESPEPEAPVIAEAPADAGPSTDTAVEATVAGKGVRAKAVGQQEWSELEEGSQSMSAGTQVQVASGSTLRVKRGDERAEVIGAAEVTVAATEGSLLTALRGRVKLEAMAQDTVILVPGGSIVAKADPKGSRTETSVDRKDGTTVRVRRGGSEISGTKGKSESLRTGESATLLPSGKISVDARAPSRAHLRIAAGESPVIHDPKPPTALRIDWGDRCPGEGIVEVARNLRALRTPSAVGAGSGFGLVWAPPGSSVYRVRCVGGDAKTVAEGKLQVRRDTGSTKLPKRPPRNIVDADGRRYTLLYQNQLPELVFRWKEAPPGTAFTLNLQNAGGTTVTHSSASARVELGSGELREGRYSWWFSGSGDAKSPVGKLRIDFDNAAPTVYLREPKPGSLRAGQPVRVRGAALPGWTVRIGDDALELDGQLRFDSEVKPPAEDDALVIRLAHPARGVHYYLRRVQRN